MPSSNDIGVRGESIFATKISKGFLLIPNFLGDKYKSVDYIINLNNTPKQKSFFFTSVKTTNKPKYTVRQKRLKISIPEKQLKQLKRMKIPVYIVGIDENREKAFIISVNGISKNSISSIPTSFPLTHKRVISLLWKEVKEFWDNSNFGSSFTSNFI